MKKMNLKLFGFGAKIVLPLFMLFGLFLVSSTSVSAQYVPEAEALGILKQHVDKYGHPALTLSQGEAMLSPEQAERNDAFYRKMFGELLFHHIMTLDYTVADAMDQVVSLAEQKQFPEESIEIIKEEYVELLAD